jgi:hypothetical protein
LNVEYGFNQPPPWTGSQSTQLEYRVTKTYAVFTPTAPPQPVDEINIGGRVFILEGSGLELQNNGTDFLQLPGVTYGGRFTFPTPMAPGETYDVTVRTQPSNPDRQCVVARGRGTATVDVTNILVICEPYYGGSFNLGFLPAIYQLLLLNN